MEEVIKEILEAEKSAAELIANAEKEAAQINAELEAELNRLRAEYEDKLRNDSSAILNSAKARIAQLHADEAEKSAKTAEKLRAEAHGKIQPCADFVYNFIVKELSK